MAYTHEDFKSGAALKRAVRSGKRVTVYQPGPFGPDCADGRHVIEGPHYPKPHTFYVPVEVKDGVITRLM